MDRRDAARNLWLMCDGRPRRASKSCHNKSFEPVKTNYIGARWTSPGTSAIRTQHVGHDQTGERGQRTLHPTGPYAVVWAQGGSAPPTPSLSRSVTTTRTITHQPTVFANKPTNNASNGMLFPEAHVASSCCVARFVGSQLSL